MPLSLTIFVISGASLTFGFVLLDAVEDVFERVVVLAACIAAVFSDCVEERGQNRRLLIWGQKRSMKTRHRKGVMMGFPALDPYPVILRADRKSQVGQCSDKH